MKSLLVVDDEKHYADSLAETIPWSTVGVSRVLKAYSASEALALMEASPVDILMTDIRMPRTSGLELIELARRRLPRLKCLLLTGHADFEYARKAIELQALDYLMKPAKDEQLLEVMGRIVKQLERERAIEQGFRIYRDNSAELKAGLLLKALGGTLSVETLAEKLKLFDLPLPIQGRVSLCLVRLGPPFDGQDLYSQSLIRFAVTNMLEELLMERYDCWPAADEDGNLLVLAYDLSGAPPDPEWVRERIDRLRREVRSLLKGEISAGEADCLFPEGLLAGYMAAKSLLDRGGRSSGRAPERNEEEARLMRMLYEAPLLTHLLETEQWEEAEAKIRAFVSPLMHSGSSDLMRDVFFFLSNAFQYIANRGGMTLAQMLSPRQAAFVKGKAMLHASQLESWALDSLRTLRDKRDEESEDHGLAIVRKTQAYIRKELDKDLSLTLLARRVFVHPNHLSKLFKQCTDTTVSQYIYEQRMLKACEMLKHTNHKIYRIGESIGYPNTNWFIRKFRDYCQVTPQEFRDRYRSGMEEEAGE
ncbi:response regulator [Cohnella thailandensis]|uniref:Response regulator n=1 Tax=Cohnella thailandensis TaxID=557557 RepID=A0A841SSN7_9BACL|nr:response regulator [Cohnella thailandensis]MBB6632930.1 response regulator [Cohnella thailandensis]MBP1975377.1 two-component system response regulator YesN [Cohnella thailandensis]